MFNNLRGAHFANNTFVDYHSTQTGIDRLFDHCLSDAAYDSYAREDKASCYPGTRTQHIQDILTWTTSIQKRQWRMLWMQGPGGVGKTTIAQTCCKESRDHGVLGASFFFSRDNGVVNPAYFFTTIAHQLASQIDEYKLLVESKISRNPTLLTKGLETQFQELIIQPFLELEKQHIPVYRRVIFVDGLDECDSNPAQAKIVHIVADSISKYEDRVPLLWAFFSRPEPHIVNAFSHHLISTQCWQVVLQLSGELDAEIRLYLRGALRRPGSQLDALEANIWPSEEEIDMLVRISGRLYVYAASLAKFIMDADSLGPEQQLREILSFHAVFKAGTGGTRKKTNPLIELDAFYQMIMSRIPGKVLPVIQRVLLLHYTLSSNSGLFHEEAPSARLLANLTGLSLKTLEDSVLRLNSVFMLKRSEGPEKYSWGSATLFFHHASFMDFMLDDARSGRYSLANRNHWSDIALRGASLLNGIHAVKGLPREEKIRRLARLLSAVPDKTYRIFHLRDEVYDCVHRNLFTWCSASNVSSDYWSLVEELGRINSELYQQFGIVESDPTFLQRLPEDVCKNLRLLTQHEMDEAEIKLGVPPDFSADVGDISEYIISGLAGIMPSPLSDMSSNFQYFIAEYFLSGPSEQDQRQIRSQIEGFFTARVQTMARKAENLSGYELLRHYTQEWNQYNKLSESLFGSAMNFESEDLKGISELAQSCWGREFLVVTQGHELRLTQAVLDLLTQQRNGDLINKVLPYSFIRPLVELDSSDPNFDYGENFGRPFLQATIQYYTTEAQHTFSQQSLLDGLKQVEERLEEESELLAEYYLPGQYCQDVILSAAKALVEGQLDQIYQEFELQLDDVDSNQHLRRMYRLVSKMGGEAANPLSTRFEAYVKDEVLVAGMTAAGEVGVGSGVPPSLDPIVYASSLLEIQWQTSEIVQRVFDGDARFVEAHKRAFEDTLREHPEWGNVMHPQAARDQDRQLGRSSTSSHQEAQILYIEEKPTSSPEKSPLVNRIQQNLRVPLVSRSSDNIVLRASEATGANESPVRATQTFNVPDGSNSNSLPKEKQRKRDKLVRLLRFPSKRDG